MLSDGQYTGILSAYCQPNRQRRVTRSYRTRGPLRVVGEVEEWEGHSPEVLRGMLNHLAQLREQGLDVIED
jgi:hypothetical protein